MKIRKKKKIGNTIIKNLVQNMNRTQNITKKKRKTPKNQIFIIVIKIIK